MVNLDKLYNWGINGPFSNDLNQLDPGTIQLIATLAPTVIDMFSGGGGDGGGSSARTDATETFTEQLDLIGEGILGKYEEFIDMAEEYMPGGKIHEGFKKEAYQTAIDTALTTSQKGAETLQSKGVDLTSYGAGTMRDIAKETYTKSFTTDYSDIFRDLTSVGTSLYETGTGLYGDYVDLLGTSAQATYMSAIQESTAGGGGGGFGSLFSLLGTAAGSQAGADLFGGLFGGGGGEDLLFPAGGAEGPPLLIP